MHRFKQQIEVNYQMATPPSPTRAPKSRGYSLFSRQARNREGDTNRSMDVETSEISRTFPSLKTSHSISSPPLPRPSILHQQPQPSSSPLSKDHRSPSSATESYTRSSNNNVQLVRVHPRLESDYIREIPKRAPLAPIVSKRLLETDFPINEEPENSPPKDSTYDAEIEKAFDYLPTHDDDDDVIHQDTDSFDDEEEEEEDNSVNTNHIDVGTSMQHSKHDSGIHTLSSAGMNDRRNDQERFNEPLMTNLSQSTVSEDYDSDFDDLPDGNVSEQVTPKEPTEEEQRNQILLQQQEILRGIVQEWSRKEESYSEQLHKLNEQLYLIANSNKIQTLIEQLIDQHRKVYQEIKSLYKHDQQLPNLTKQLTQTVATLMQTLSYYDDYIKLNLAPIRKALDKRSITNGLSSEDLLSIPPKQFLQILSQVQDLYQTAQSFESGDLESLTRLYNYAQRCRLYGSRQDENINSVVLKNEDVATVGTRGNRDRCRLILYPDAIVCCNLRAKLLASPKYVLLWFIPIIDLQWTVPPSSSDDNPATDDVTKSSLKSAYREIEKNPKNNNSINARFTKNLRKHENDFNLSQSKLQLILSNPSRSSTSSIILFSSAYQRQDWIDLIDKTKQDLIQRTAAVLNNNNHSQRLNDTLIQKRLDFIKPTSHETNPNDASTTIQTLSTAKTYSGTLFITIHSIYGAALFNPLRQYHTLPVASSTQQQLQRNYRFYVAVEVDTYNTFYPYAQTSKQSMQQQDTVEFKGEVFEVELEYSLAFRLLIYRMDASIENKNTSLQRSTCIGKFHREIEPALRDCQRSSNNTLLIKSQTGDLELKISLKYQRRDGTFKRQPSKRNVAVFGKKIDQLMAVPSGLVDGIPRIIVKCIALVENDGLTETGIYRVCCVASDLQKLRHEFDKNYHRGEEMLAQKNVHVAANLLKMFFRELPEPLFTSTFYKEFVNAIQLTDVDNQRVMLLKTFELLHADNRKILFYLFDHLIRVSQHSNTNMMHLENLAVVFGPTLMRPGSSNLSANGHSRFNPSSSQATSTDLDSMASELKGSMYQCQVVLLCLKLRRDGLLK